MLCWLPCDPSQNRAFGTELQLPPHTFPFLSTLLGHLLQPAGTSLQSNVTIPDAKCEGNKDREERTHCFDVLAKTRDFEGNQLQIMVGNDCNWFKYCTTSHIISAAVHVHSDAKWPKLPGNLPFSDFYLANHGEMSFLHSETLPH